MHGFLLLLAASPLDSPTWYNRHQAAIGRETRRYLNAPANDGLQKVVGRCFGRHAGGEWGGAAETVCIPSQCFI